MGIGRAPTNQEHTWNTFMPPAYTRLASGLHSRDDSRQRSR